VWEKLSGTTTRRRKQAFPVSNGGEMMAFLTPRRRLAGLLTLAVMLGAGCNLASLSYFLLPHEDPHFPPELMKLSPRPGYDTSRVVILCSLPIDTGIDFIRIDRDLTSALARQITHGYEELDKKEKVVVIRPSKVEKFKDDHPDWHTMELVDIGKRFQADYVIRLDVQAISLYEKGSSNLMYRGRATVSVAALDMHHGDDEPVTKEYVTEYPSDAKGPVPVDDRNRLEFRQAFLEHIAKGLSWYFVPHLTRDKFDI
jgi:hypothetical protein